MARYSGGSFILADYFGTFIWGVFMDNETSRSQKKEKKAKKRKEMYNQ
jgi:hypothetical protein